MPQKTAEDREFAPIRELSDRYEGEWLLIKILDPNLPVGDARGELLVRADDRNAIFKAERKIRKQLPSALLTSFRGGMKFGDGEAFRRAIDRIIASGEWVSVNPW